MKYVVLYQGRVIWGPREWNSLSIENAIEMYVSGEDVVIGVDPVVGRLEQQQDIIILSVESDIIPEYDALFETLEGPLYQHDVPHGITRITWNVVPDHLPYIKGKIKQQIEARRYQKEVEGIDIEVGDTTYRFPTDREQRNRLMIQSISGDPVSWKIAGMWVDLTSEQLGDVVKQINSHVQRWFVWEKTKVELIDSLTTIDQLKQLHTSIVEED